MGIGSRRAAAVAGLLMVLVALVDTALAAPARAAIGGVTIDARVDSQRVRSSSETRPIRLSPKRSALVIVELTNNTDRPLDIRTVRLEGRVMGLTFFAYDTAVAMTVAPGAKGTRRFPLDLGGLRGQATGLIPTSVKLVDVHRDVVAEESGVADVRGSLLSIYGLFGIGLAILTLLGLLGILVGLARRRLPQDRWRRAVRFMTVGIALGLLLDFTLAATRVFVPGIGRWLTIAIVSALVFFGLGYLTATRELAAEEAEEQEEPALFQSRTAPQPKTLPQKPALPPLPPPPEPVLEASEPEPVVDEAPPPEKPPLEATAEPPAPPPVEAAPDEPVPTDGADVTDIAEVAEVIESAPESPEPTEAEAEPVPPEPPEPEPEPAHEPEVVRHYPIVVPCHLPPEEVAGDPSDKVASPHPFPTVDRDR